MTIFSSGIPDSAYKIFDLYKKRVEERVAKAKEVLKENFDFTSDRTVEINRQKAPWAKDEAAADKLWHDRIEGELLQEHFVKAAKPAPAAVKPDQSEADLKKDAPAPAPTDPVHKLTKRYDQLIHDLHEQTRDDVIKIFLTTLAQTYDPHSDYMSRSELESLRSTWS